MASPTIPEQTRSRELLIEHTRKLLDARNFNYEIVSPVGDAGHKISAVADENQTDLIVVPAANASFLEALVHAQRERQCRTQRPPRRPPRREHRRGKLVHARHASRQACPSDLGWNDCCRG